MKGQTKKKASKVQLLTALTTQEGGFESTQSMYNFTVLEFGETWMILAHHVIVTWNVGRGRKTYLCEKDIPFMSQCAFKQFL